MSDSSSSSSSSVTIITMLSMTHSLPLALRVRARLRISMSKLPDAHLQQLHCRLRPRITLPTILLDEVFSYLLLHEFAHAAATCAYFNAASRRAPLHAFVKTRSAYAMRMMSQLRQVIFEGRLTELSQFSRIESMDVTVLGPPTRADDLFKALREYCPRLRHLRVKNSISAGPCSEIVSSITSARVVDGPFLSHADVCLPSLTSLHCGVVTPLIAAEILPRISLLNTLTLTAESDTIEELTQTLTKLTLRTLTLNIDMTTIALEPRPVLIALSRLTVRRLSINLQYKSFSDAMMLLDAQILCREDEPDGLSLGKSHSIRVQFMGPGESGMLFENTVSRGTLSQCSGACNGAYYDVDTAALIAYRLGCLRGPDALIGALDYVLKAEYSNRVLVSLELEMAVPGLWARLESTFVNLTSLHLDRQVHADAPWGGRRPFSRGMLPSLTDLTLSGSPWTGLPTSKCARTCVTWQWNDIVFSRLSQVVVHLRCKRCNSLLELWLRTHTSIGLVCRGRSRNVAKKPEPEPIRSGCVIS